jgi:hypothetical protein
MGHSPGTYTSLIVPDKSSTGYFYRTNKKRRITAYNKKAFLFL